MNPTSEYYIASCPLCGQSETVQRVSVVVNSANHNSRITHLLMAPKDENAISRQLDFWIYALCGLMMIITAYEIYLFTLFLGLILGRLAWSILFASYRKQRAKETPNLLKRWNTMYFCHKDGLVFIPGGPYALLDSAKEFINYPEAFFNNALQQSSNSRNTNEFLEFLKILFIGITATFIFNTVQQIFLAYYCTYFFTNVLTHWLDTSDPLLLGLGWGVFGSWWIGLPLSFIFWLSTRVGSLPKRSTLQLIIVVSGMVIFLWLSSLISGIIGYYISTANINGIQTFWTYLLLYGNDNMPPELFTRINAVHFANGFSYFSGVIGVIIVSEITYGQRWLQRYNSKSGSGT